MGSEPACLGQIPLDFAEIKPRQYEKFPYTCKQMGQPGKAG